LRDSKASTTEFERPNKHHKHASSSKKTQGKDSTSVSSSFVKTSSRSDRGGGGGGDRHQNGGNNRVKKRVKSKLNALPDLKKAQIRELTAEERTRSKKAGNKNVFGQLSFEELKLHPNIIRTLRESLHMTQPTRIQAQALPPVLSKRDVLLKSMTGSGKTLAFLLPVVHLLLEREVKVNREHGTYAIVLAPTRELCLQIWTVLSTLTRFFPWMVAGHVMGGEKKKSEKARLRKGVSILVATPGNP